MEFKYRYNYISHAIGSEANVVYKHEKYEV